MEWKRSLQNNRAPGATCLKAVRNLEAGKSWQQAGINDAKGCGSAMRVATIGYFFQHQPAKLREVAHLSGLITHSHPTASAACVAGAYLVKLALDGVQPEAYIRHLLTFCQDISTEFNATIQRAAGMLMLNAEENAMQHIGEGWVADEAIGLGLYCVLRNPNDYVAGVRRGVNSSGDSDSIACIAGGILGARLGLDAIPADWRDRCENRDYLIPLAGRMAQAKMAFQSP